MDQPKSESTGIELEKMETGLYTLIGEGERKRLQKLPERDDDRPRIAMAEEVRKGVQDICRGLRKRMGGYRPDISLATEALVLKALEDVETAENTIIDYGMLKFQQARTTETE